jgi:hypothetical protein
LGLGRLDQLSNSLIGVYGTPTQPVRTRSASVCQSNAACQLQITLLHAVCHFRLETRGYGESYDYLRVKTADNVNEPLNRQVEIQIPISQTM